MNYWEPKVKKSRKISGKFDMHKADVVPRHTVTSGDWMWVRMSVNSTWECDERK